MTRNDKFNIQRRTVWRNFWQRLSGVPDLAAKLLFVALYLAGMVWVWSKQEAVSAYAQSVEFMSPIMLAAMTYVVPAYLIVGGAVLAVLMVYPFGRKAAQDQLRSIGLVNRAEMVPELLRKRQDKEHPRVTVWSSEIRASPSQSGRRSRRIGSGLGRFYRKNHLWQEQESGADLCSSHPNQFTGYSAVER